MPVTTANSLPLGTPASPMRGGADQQVPASLRRLIGTPVGDVEAVLGDPLLTFAAELDERDAAPGGGIVRRYQAPWGLVEVVFDGGKAVGLELTFEHGRPANADEALRQLGLPTGRTPGSSSPSHLGWADLNGHEVILAVDPRPRNGTTGRKDADDEIVSAVIQIPASARTRSSSALASPPERPVPPRLSQLLTGSVDDVEAVLGDPMAAYEVGPDEYEAAPGGAEVRLYQEPWGIVEAVYDGGRAVKLTLSFEQSRPANIDAALRQLGLTTGRTPGSQGPTQRAWPNLDGQDVTIAFEPSPRKSSSQADTEDGTVLSAILQIPSSARPRFHSALALTEPVVRQAQAGLRQILGKAVKEVEAVLGAPLVTYTVGPNEREGAPGGAEIRKYQKNWGLAEVVFAGGRAVLLEVTFEYGRPKGTDDALRQMGLATGRKTASRGPSYRSWPDLDGQQVTVAVDPGRRKGLRDPDPDDGEAAGVTISLPAGRR